MSQKSVTILFIADIVGKPGYEVLSAFLPSIKKKYHVDLTVANGENGFQGKGITEVVAKKYLNIGVDVITGGNHIWNFADYRRYLDTSPKVLRPANYPDETPGKGSGIFKTEAGIPIGVLNLQGRTFMFNIDCPFKRAEDEVQRLRQHTPIIFVDIHAEATAEKIALAWNLDGQVSAVVGTHTHVQTADERILPRGTAYISDAGMTGPFDSVIGMDVDTAIFRFKTGLPEKYKLANSNNRLNGVIVKVNSQNGRAESIERINLP